MTRIKKRYFINIICLLSANSFAQQTIQFTRSYQCDTTIKSNENIKIEIGNLQCIEDPGKDQLIYFTKKEEFQAYALKNKISRDHCKDKVDMIFDFSKNDVVFIRTEIKNGSSHDTIEVFEKNDYYSIKLNFFIKNQEMLPKSEDIKKEYQVFPEFHFYTRFYLLPKGKVNKPEFHIYETLYNCF